MSKAVNLLVFSIGVITLLLRPYMAYQLTGQGAIAKDQTKTRNLLQRLIKKKDDHHEQQESPATNQKSICFSFRPIMRLIPALTGFLSFLLSWQVLLNKYSLKVTTAYTRPQRRRYRLVSCFLI